MTAQGCRESSRSPAGVTLTLIHQSWIDRDSQRLLNEELQQFTNRSGIRVEILPAPETAVEQLATWRKLLESEAGVPDVYAIDVIWPGWKERCFIRWPSPRRLRWQVRPLSLSPSCLSCARSLFEASSTVKRITLSCVDFVRSTSRL